MIRTPQLTSAIESYVRSSDGATMVAFAPGMFVNKALLGKLGLGVSPLTKQP